jgi:hypothetical protein
MISFKEDASKLRRLWLCRKSLSSEQTELNVSEELMFVSESSDRSTLHQTLSIKHGMKQIKVEHTRLTVAALPQMCLSVRHRHAGLGCLL